MRSVMLAVLALGLASGGVAIWAASGHHWIAVVVCGLAAVILAGFAAVALATDWKNAQWRHGDHIRLDVAAYSRFAADVASEIVHAPRRDDGSIDQDHPDVAHAGDRLWYRAGVLGMEER